MYNFQLGILAVFVENLDILNTLSSVRYTGCITKLLVYATSRCFNEVMASKAN